eukprot:TRINITY_DN7277_c0_g1_i1.p1 TRINITY_DN7277_c0_g1~~TRINITY_DN7277_c0_g1_i1.p1  ORF type:complete len:317 (+),score=81.15 TRINITY_DN7277_c0_g1_i1:177-1127(+)
MVSTDVPTTDSVRIVLPKNATPTAAVEGLKKLGAIARYEKIRQGRVLDIVFYDTRTSKQACDTLGKCCTLQPRSKLQRTVQLPGCLPLDMADLPCVVSVKASTIVQGAFTVEFYDSRTAKRYQAKADEVGEGKKASFASAPPGLAPPPGLELPTGLAADAKPFAADKNDDALSCASTTAASARCSVDDEPVSSSKYPQVKIRGLPAAMMSECTLTAMLQQAGLDSAIKNMTTNKCGQTGEVLLDLADAESAQQCMSHFNGRRWGASLVEAEVLGGSTPKKAPTAKQLSATAAVFVPVVPNLSASAPVFIPGASSAW